MNKEEHAAGPRPARIERKLAAILHADVQGYSRLLGKDEVTTLRTVASHLGLMRSLVEQHSGRAVGSRGDSLLAEFPSVVEAVQCAVEMQYELQQRNSPVPASQRVEFRVGINLGEVVVEGEEIYGEGVNIAVRLEGVADAGGLCISEVVYQQLKNKLTLSYEDLGAHTLKNIAEPVRVWRVVMDDAATALAQQVGAGPARPLQHRVGSARRLWPRGVLAGVLLLMGLFGTVWYLRHPYLSSHDSTFTTPAQPALPLPDRPSIIVLPFVNMSQDPDQEYFSDGLTETLTGDLSKISSLFVIARNSAFTYKGKAAKVQDVGREMGVRYVLEGSVLKAAGQVRITTQLIDATTGYHLWSERYDRSLKDIFALQDEIVQKIVTTLRLQLALQEQGYSVRKHTDNLQAYDTFLRGMEYYRRYTKEANPRAQQTWEKALALDPQYAEAYAWLGVADWLGWVFHWNMDPQTLEHAFALAQKALTLDDSLPMGHLLLSAVYTQHQQYEQAIAEGERAIALDPNNADTYEAQAVTLNFAGRPAEAIQAVAQAMRLNPRPPATDFLHLGWAYRLTGRYAEATTTLKEALSRNPNLTPAYLHLALSYLWQWLSQQSPATQTLEPAVEAAQRALALNDSLHWSHIVFGYLSLYQQQYEQALAEMKQGVALAPTEAGTYAALAEVLSCMGRSEDSLEAAAQALRLKTTDAVDEYLARVGTAYTVAGHYEEARVPLQRFLSRYPNILRIHLMLAVVYSELGQAAEARAEAAKVLQLNPKFSLEVHKQRMPIKDPAVLERHIEALHKAGLK